MCGILCSISAGPCSAPTPDLLAGLKARGPDSCGNASATLTQHKRCDSHGNLVTGKFSSHVPRVSVTCYSSVLSLRGKAITRQPLQEPKEELNGIIKLTSHDLRPVLCWNGEIWSYEGKPLPAGLSDSAFLYEQLCEAVLDDDILTREGITGADGSYDYLSTQVSHCLEKIEGPFAFIFVDQANGRLYYGRDTLGRRSLLVKQNGETEWLLASVGDGDTRWIEVEAGRLHTLFMERTSRPVADSSGHPTMKFPDAEIRLSYDNHAYKSLVFNCQIPESPLPLLNKNSPSVGALQKLLLASLVPRIVTLPLSSPADAARFAILFSGGLDCTTLARMMHDILPHEESVDLLNVAFENPRTTSHLTKEEIYSSCPDRVTAIASHAELVSVCPSRTWRLVTIDIPYSETLAHRPIIKRLMHPHDTEMDLSIASALYFAARGQGVAHASAPQLDQSSANGAQTRIDSIDAVYSTPARILISGLGADELFAGYQRHATAFSRGFKTSALPGAYEALLAELELDYRRLGARNLGRDDRVLSHWGRECRFPFLDERLVRWVVSLGVGEKCGFDAAYGIDPRAPLRDGELEPGKKVLRLVAVQLGMHKVAREKKRAIQFGARSAKMESGKSRGTDVL